MRFLRVKTSFFSLAACLGRLGRYLSSFIEGDVLRLNMVCAFVHSSSESWIFDIGQHSPMMYYALQSRFSSSGTQLRMVLHLKYKVQSMKAVDSLTSQLYTYSDLRGRMRVSSDLVAATTRFHLAKGSH